MKGPTGRRLPSFRHSNSQSRGRKGECDGEDLKNCKHKVVANMTEDLLNNNNTVDEETEFSFKRMLWNSCDILWPKLGSLVAKVLEYWHSR